MSTAAAPTEGTGWSVRAYSVADANGGTAAWTVIGGRPGDAAANDPGVGAVTQAGSPAAEAITGTSGDDTIMGGGGADILAGGAGADTFLYVLGDGNDTINGFELGDDRLVLMGISQVAISASATTAVVALPDGAQITLHTGAAATDADTVLIG